MRNALPALGALLVLAGCGEQDESHSPGTPGMPGGKIEAVSIRYYPTFPPKRGEEEQTFDLSEEELAQCVRICPDLTEAQGIGCPSVVPPFTFSVRYQGGAVTLAQFCCGSIRTWNPVGNLTSTPGLLQFLIEAVRRRAGDLEWFERLYGAELRAEAEK